MYVCMHVCIYNSKNNNSNNNNKNKITIIVIIYILWICKTTYVKETTWQFLYCWLIEWLLFCETIYTSPLCIWMHMCISIYNTIIYTYMNIYTFYIYLENPKPMNSQGLCEYPRFGVKTRGFHFWSRYHHLKKWLWNHEDTSRPRDSHFFSARTTCESLCLTARLLETIQNQTGRMINPSATYWS